MLGNIGPFEILIVLIIALIVFGPKRLPELGSSLGKGIREFRGAVSGEKHEEDEEVKAIAEAPSTPPEGQAKPEHEVVHDERS